MVNRESLIIYLNFLDDYPNKELNNDILNKLTKDLYNSGLFSKITLNVKDTTLHINVVEHLQLIKYLYWK